MTLVQLVFYVFSAIAIFSGLMVVVVRNPVHSVLFLVLTFFAMAGDWILLHAEFLALVLVLVYVGAVMTLFLFVVMMINIDLIGLRKGFVRYLPLAVVIVLLVMGLTLVVIDPDRFGLMQMPAPALKSESYNNLTNLGLLLYTDFAYPFEIAGMLLLTAIVAAICLAHRDPKNRKGQIPADQIAVKRADRIRILKMPTEKKS